MSFFRFCFFILFIANFVNAQSIPADEENIPFLVTFGNSAKKGYGDDDHQQIFFLSIPKNFNEPFFIRVFDPDVGGKNDEAIGNFNSVSRFSVYGGFGTFSERASTNFNFQSGNLLATRNFGYDQTVDNKWFTFGPFDPTQGEDVNELDGRIFKIVSSGLSGDDGNLYRYFVSTQPNRNTAVNGANAFTFKYTFRLPSISNEVVHIYPYINSDVISVKQFNFDFDQDGSIQIVSAAKNGLEVAQSMNADWVSSTHEITEIEHNRSLDIRFIKPTRNPLKNNNIVFYMTNQYGEQLPFYNVPIGGIPRYQYKISVKRVIRN